MQGKVRLRRGIVEGATESWLDCLVPNSDSTTASSPSKHLRALQAKCHALPPCDQLPGTHRPQSKREEYRLTPSLTLLYSDPSNHPSPSPPEPPLSLPPQLRQLPLHIRHHPLQAHNLLLQRPHHPTLRLVLSIDGRGGGACDRGAAPADGAVEARVADLEVGAGGWGAGEGGDGVWGGRSVLADEPRVVGRGGGGGKEDGGEFLGGIGGAVREGGYAHVAWVWVWLVFCEIGVGRCL